MRKTIYAILAAVSIGEPAAAEPITIFAASSMKTGLDQVIADKGLDAIAAYGGSAAIARQLTQGAGADIVILAHGDWMDWLDAQGALASETRCDLVGNALVLAGGSDQPDLDLRAAGDVIDALEGGRLAVGQLQSVPAGQYAAAYLEGRGWLEELRPHLAQTSNVRLALALVARGQSPLGFVYSSDIVAQPRVHAVFTPDPDHYPKIRYPMVRTANAAAGVDAVFNALSSAQATFAQNGFLPLNANDPSACRAS